MVKARSVDVKNTTTPRPQSCCYFSFLAFLGRDFFLLTSLRGAFFLLKCAQFYLSVPNFTKVCPIMVVDDVCCLYLCRFVGFRGVSVAPTPQISWHKTTSARFRLLCHPLCIKFNKHMLTPAHAFVNAEKAHLCRSPCEHYGSGPINCCKNLNTSKPCEHPPSGEKLTKKLGGNIGCRDKNSWYQKGSPNVVT